MSSTTGESEALLQSIAEVQQTLSIGTERIEESLPAMKNLLYAYQEGWLTLDALLNAVQIEATGLQEYYEQLIAYYADIFRLEAITGARIVTFEP